MFLLNRLRLLDDLVFRHLFVIGQLCLLLLKLHFFFFSEFWVSDYVSGKLAPLARVDWKFRQHDPSEHLVFVGLESKTHDLETDA